MDKLGCKTVADLLKVEGEKILEASSVLFTRQFPERDGKYLPADPFKAYEDGAAKDIEFLVGCNKDEMNFFVSSFAPDGKVHEWPLYDPENKKVMVLDEFDIHTEKETERKIIDWDRTYFLTKYYMV